MGFHLLIDLSRDNCQLNNRASGVCWVCNVTIFWQESDLYHLVFQPERPVNVASFAASAFAVILREIEFNVLFTSERDTETHA